ncbi:hypothetical protein [Corynebacterium lowii]|nr:hypothetical protein [Corynebacterium lowii]MDP9852486.1 hypothetical protein [Corynebacterium lowii]
MTYATLPLSEGNNPLLPMAYDLAFSVAFVISWVVSLILIIDIVRRPISGWERFGLSLMVLFLPVIGWIIYTLWRGTSGRARRPQKVTGAPDSH